MADTKKVEQICAMRLEDGKLIGSAWGWNGSTIQSLGANNGMPYIEKSIKITPVHGTDDSIENEAFTDLPTQLGLEAPMDNIGGIVRYNTFMDKLLYWMLGYEDGGSSPVDAGGGYYTHLFELDKHERHFTAYRTAEQTAGDYDATDRKNRAATFAFKRGPNDHRYRHVMCSGFSFSSSADDGFIRWSASGIAPREDRGDYSSGSWTYPTEAVGSSMDALHRHTTVSIKEQGGSFTDLGVSAWEVGVEIPLKFERDTESGLYLTEPVLSGKYGITASITLTRHSVDTYLAYRDDWTSTKLCLKIVAATGSYQFGIYLPELRISDAFPSEEDVAKQPITFQTRPVDADTANIFATEIGTHALIQEGNIFIITKDKNSTNEMRRE